MAEMANFFGALTWSFAMTGRGRTKSTMSETQLIAPCTRPGIFRWLQFARTVRSHGCPGLGMQKTKFCGTMYEISWCSRRPCAKRTLTCLPIRAHKEYTQYPACTSHPNFDMKHAMVKHKNCCFCEEIHRPDHDTGREQLLHVVHVDFADGRIPSMSA